MRLTKKRGAIALVGVVAVTAAVAIPTVLASSSASGGPLSTAGPKTAGPKPAAPFGGTCTTSKTAFASDTYSDESTTSQSFIPVTGMSVNFTSTTHCAEITFSDIAAALDGDLMYVRVLVDGTTCLPGNVQWSQTPNFYTATSYTFVCQFGGNAFHPHNAVVQYRSYNGLGAFTAYPTMVVHYS